MKSSLQTQEVSSELCKLFENILKYSQHFVIRYMKVEKDTSRTPTAREKYTRATGDDWTMFQRNCVFN